MAKLLLKLHEAIVKEIPLEKPGLTIGRKTDNDLVIDDQVVSGYHAKIEQVQSVFFIQDLGSSNGTFANKKRIERKQLVNGDQISIGQHVLIFQEDVSRAVVPPPASKTFDSDKTVFVSPAQQRELLKAQDPSRLSMTMRSKKNVGILQVVSGSTDRREYEITGPVAIIGSQDGATIKLTGWFAPKRAASLSRLGEGYAIGQAEDGKKVLVNGTPIQAQTPLKDGDLIEVAGIKLLYSVKEEA